MSEALQLTTQGTAAAEKKLVGFKKNMRLWFGMMRGAYAQMLGYRVLIGHELNRAKEELPHGEFEAWCKEEFGLSPSTQQRWREFSAVFLTEAAKLSKNPTVGLLGKKSKAAVETIMEVAPKVMEGKGEVEFMRDIKLMREPAPAGGDRGGDKHASRKPTAAEEIENATAMLATYAEQVQTMLNDRDNFLKGKPTAIETLNTLRIELGKHIDALKKERKG